MSGLHFQDPLWFLLLIPVVLMPAWSARRRRRTAVLYSDTTTLARLPQTIALRVKRLLPWGRALGMGLLVVALARPQHGKEEFRVRTEGIAIQMCIDRSGSMQALDFYLDGTRVNRLEAVKAVFRGFVAGNERLPGRPDDLIGLIDFGGFAEARCPLTLDHDALLEMLEAVQIPEPTLDARGRANEDLLQEDMATAIGDALVLAVDRLKNVRAKSKIIVLLSDGKQTAGVIQPAEAAEAAKAFGIKVYTIGVGTTGLAPFPTVDFFGRKVIRRQPVELDEGALSMLAKVTGGRYFNAQSTDALEGVYAEIDQLETTPSEGLVYTQYRELYAYLLFPGMGLVLLEVLMVSTRFRSLP